MVSRYPISTDETGILATGTTRRPIGGAGTSGGRTVWPTGIAKTEVLRATPALGPTYYGSIFKHTLKTTGGTITPDITITELVWVTRDDFATGFTGVPLGTLTWGSSSTAPLYGNDIYDNIGTSNINVQNFLPSPPKLALPAVMETPQELYYRVGNGNWVKFASVPIIITLRAKNGSGIEVETNKSGVASIQNYTGPV